MAGILQWQTQMLLAITDITLMFLQAALLEGVSLFPGAWKWINA